MLVIMLTACKNSNNNQSYTTQTQVTNVKKDTVHPGEKLMKVYCYSCHDATTSEDLRLAPPMIAIKRRYIFKDTSKEEFISDIQEWIKNPTEKNAKMYGAVKRFGVMPKMYYPEDIIAKISDYMYDNDIEQPEWFEEHYRQNMGDRNRNRGGF